MVDLSAVVTALSAISSIAVIAGALFIIFQLRQNSKLIRATILENRSAIAFSMLEKIIDESFVKRRTNVHEAMKKYGSKNWEGFDDSYEDLEARNHAYMFELFGQLVNDGIVDKKTMMNALKYIIVFDWRAMEPMIRHVNQRYGLKVNPWGNFEWLAKETEKYLREQEAQASKTGTVGAG